MNKALLFTLFLTTSALAQPGGIIAAPQGVGGTTTPSVEPGLDTNSKLLRKGQETLSADSTSSPDQFLTDSTNRMLLQPRMAGMQGGMAEVVNELVLILGEIVVDRATNRAFDLLKDKLEVGLSCSKTPPQTSRFRSTCEVVAPLRLQELAVTTSALQGAVTQDALRMALDTTVLKSGGMSNEDYAVLARIVQADLLPHLTRPHRPWSDAEASTLVQDLLAFAIDKATQVTPCSQTTESAKTTSAAVMVTAGAALASCLKTSLELGVQPADCAVMQLSDEFANRCPYLVNSSKREAYTHHARIIAQHLHAAVTARVEGKADPRLRMGHAVDAALEMGCRFADLDAGCDSALDVVGTAHKDAQAIGLLRTVSHAALDRDTNALIGAASRAVSLVDAAQTPAAQRGLRIVGGVLQYAETWYQPTTIGQEGSARVEAVTDADTVEAAHASRRKILESLTEEMTDRTGRDNDVLFSVGGSLRATAGVRFVSGAGRDEEFEGPLSLPLGLGVQVPLSQQGGHGLHFEAGVVDLGRYVAIRDRTVDEFDAADALAPSLTAGYYWGQQLPFFLGVSGIYQPLFSSAEVPAEDGRPAIPASVGAWSLTFNVGVYVPLFDLN
ncbi:hypothetical protein [Corallococcus sp. CA053C]|uniref:hypothetical protein n=1 Tax=Corallococcus sp. CA053C TaxID=2316732 RepID=UPI0011C40016|nr:hypothetical protein [Corallococcus sp. CA053C]